VPHAYREVIQPHALRFPMDVINVQASRINPG
jgi:hypothetical protein